MVISFEYYDEDTRNMLKERLTSEDEEYMKTIKDTMEQFLFKRWNTIVNSLPSNYYNQYYSQTTPEARNEWFKKYLDYPTKDIMQMPNKL